MAEINHFYDEENAQGFTTSVTFTNTMISGSNPASILGSSLAANTKYLIIARGLFRCNSVTPRVGVRVQTDDDSTIASKSEASVEMELTAAGDYKSYFFAHSFTTDASPADVEIQVATTDTDWAVTVDQTSLLLIDLDDLGTEGTEYHEDIQADPGDGSGGNEYSTSADTTVLASLAAADLGTTEEWLVLGYARTHVGSTGRWFNITADGADDAASASTLNEAQEEGEDAAEMRVTGIVARHKAVTSNVAFTVYGQEEAANGNMWDGGAYLIALKASLFDDFEHDYTAAAATISAETTIATVGPYTPTTSGNHLIVGRMHKGTADADFMQLHLEDGTTPTRTGDDTPTHDQNWDTAKDLEPAYTLERISISAAKTYNLRANVTGTSYTAEDRWLLVLNLNKVAGSVGTPIPRRQLTTARM
jgi:hypothetical protein